MNKVISAHDALWKTSFERECAALCDIFGSAALAVHHIGSTAIPGIWAKPVIDILVVATDLSLIDDSATKMAATGYEARGEYGIPGRRYFSKHRCAAATGFHVHVYAEGSPHIVRHLAFRDYLLARPDVAGDYSEMKRTIANTYGVLPADYAIRKERFVSEAEEAALLRFGPRVV